MEWLKGKKTYGSALIGLLYLAGAAFGWWELKEEVLGAIGFSTAMFLRAGVTKSEPKEGK